MKNLKIEKGEPIYGPKFLDGGVNFGLFSRNANSVTLELYENFYDEKPFFSYDLDNEENKTGDIWHIYIHDIKDRTYYGWRVDGEYNPKNGKKFNKNKLLIDPYSIAVSGTYDYSETYIYGYDKKSEDDKTFSTEDSGVCSCKSIIIDDKNFNWEGIKNPRIRFNDTIIYEMHVRLFTMNPNSSVENRGTFNGLIEKLDYLKNLGVTSLELMPVFEFNPDSNTNINPKTGEKLKDIWGYNPLNFFAVTGNYTTGLRLGEQVFEFKQFVKEVHKRGMEVILDVVYNHTGEGNHYGPTISFRGIDNEIYYILENNKRYYANYSGTGNTLNCSHTVVKEMITDSLRYWVKDMKVDGFRFDLAAILGRDSNGNWIGDLSLLKDLADDPILSGSKLIAEGWDAAGGYYVGEFPTGWAEWNGKYRDTVRKFVRGDKGQVGDLATRIAGSPDLFKKDGRNPTNSVNFITAHDGFTIWDLVSYNRKHNFLNGENNRDGTNDNYSFNHGIEGETDDISILNLRKKQIKNFLVILMTSQGTPMLLMGDEILRSQNGNNNAYCHDNELTWVDWSLEKKNNDILEFFKKIIQFRKDHVCLRREHFFTGQDYTGDGIADVTWHGVKPYKPDFNYESHTLAYMISGEDYLDEEHEIDNDIYVALNSYTEPLEFELPLLKNKSWYLVVDTSKNPPNDILDKPEKIGLKYKVEAKSSIILISK
jgi:glycogen operon protein